MSPKDIIPAIKSQLPKKYSSGKFLIVIGPGREVGLNGDYFHKFFVFYGDHPAKHFGVGLGGIFTSTSGEFIGGKKQFYFNKAAPGFVWSEYTGWEVSACGGQAESLSYLKRMVEEGGD